MASPVRARENIVASSMNISTPSVKLPSFNPAEYNTASASGRRSSLGAADSGAACDMSTNVSLYNDEEDVPGGEVKRRSMGFGSRTPSVQEFMDAMGINFAAAAGAPRLQRKSVVASSMPPAMTGTASEDKLRGAYVHEVKRTSVEHAIVKVKESAREFKNAAARKEVILNRQGFHALDVFVGSSDEQVLADVHSTMRLCKKAARLEADHMWIPWRTKQERTTQQALAIMIERMDKDMAAVSVAKADIKSQRDELRRGRASKASALAQGAPLRFEYFTFMHFFNLFPCCSAQASGIVSKIKNINQTCAATEDQISSLQERLAVTPTASAISSELLGSICTRGSVYTSLTHMEIALCCGGFTLKQLSPSFVHAQVSLKVEFENCGRL
jgi:hypothetical protein